MELKRPWKLIKTMLLAWRINLKLSLTNIWSDCSWIWWGLQNIPRKCVSGPRSLRAKIQLENCCYLTWTCFAVDIEKALFSSLFPNFHIWKEIYFLSFLYFRLNKLYSFNIFSQIIFFSFLIILLFSSGTCPVGQNPSSVVVTQTREKHFPVLRRIKERLCMLYKQSSFLYIPVLQLHLL